MDEKIIRTEDLTDEQIAYLLRKQAEEGHVGMVYFQDFVALNTKTEEEKEARRNAALDEMIAFAEDYKLYD